MKKILSLAMACILAITPSCGMFSSSSLNQMDQVSYDQLVANVDSAAFLSGFIIKDKASPKATTALRTISQQLIAGVQAHAITLPNSLAALLDQYTVELNKAGVDQVEIELIKVSVRLVDTAVGGIRIEIGGEGQERSQDVLLHLIQGLERGLR